MVIFARFSPKLTVFPITHFPSKCVPPSFTNQTEFSDWSLQESLPFTKLCILKYMASWYISWIFSSKETLMMEQQDDLTSWLGPMHSKQNYFQKPNIGTIRAKYLVIINQWIFQLTARFQNIWNRGIHKLRHLLGKTEEGLAKGDTLLHKSNIEKKWWKGGITIWRWWRHLWMPPNKGYYYWLWWSSNF